MLRALLGKGLRELLRSPWILLLTVSLAPFFVVVYYFINESESTHFEVLVFNEDQGAVWDGEEVRLGVDVVGYLLESDGDSLGIPVNLQLVDSRKEGTQALEDGKADALIILPAEFSTALKALSQGETGKVPVELVGDLTQPGYLIAAVWAGEVITDLVHSITGIPRPLQILETALGTSSQASGFDLWMPGLIILSLIMLMCTATLALVTEVDQGTILRLKLSSMSPFVFLLSVVLIQLLLGIISILLTLGAAWLLGFHFQGNFAGFLLITVLTSLSIIAFSILLAAFTRTVNEVLIIGNFPLFLFMFFTGAAFPLRPRVWFELGGYGVGWNGFLSATHGVDALRRLLLYNQGLGEVLPQILLLVGLTLLYGCLGGWLFHRRQLRIDN